MDSQEYKQKLVSADEAVNPVTRLISAGVRTP